MPVLPKSNRKINIICPTSRNNSELKLENHSESADLHLPNCPFLQFCNDEELLKLKIPESRRKGKSKQGLDSQAEVQHRRG